MKVGVIGTGYVGLVSGTCFAEMGNDVVCVDVDQAKVDKLSSGQVTIYEPGLETIFERNVQRGNLRFTTQLSEAASHGDILFLALPTPPQEDGSADLSYVLGVARDLAALLREEAERYKVIVNKSTVPVGTGDVVRQALLDAGLSEDRFDVVSNPEFLREGVAMEDFMKPERIVVGTSSDRAANLMQPTLRAVRAAG